MIECSTLGNLPSDHVYAEGSYKASLLSPAYLNQLTHSDSGRSPTDLATTWTKVGLSKVLLDAYGNADVAGREFVKFPNTATEDRQH